MKKNNLIKNISCYFIFPIYGGKVQKNSIIDYYLINCYIDEYFYAVFENSDDGKLKPIIYQLQINEYCIDCFYDDNDKEIVLKFQIPTEFENDIKLFKKGRYTKFSLRFKKILQSVHGSISSRKERNKKGEPVKLIQDIIFPTEEKIQDIADFLKVDKKHIIQSHGEIYDPPNLELESFKKVTQIYGIEQQDIK